MRPFRHGSASIHALVAAALLAACSGGDAANDAGAGGGAQAPAAAAAAAPAPSQSGGTFTPADVRSHRLSLDRTRAVYQAVAEWRRGGGRPESLDTPENGGQDQVTIADGVNAMAARIETQPELAAALQRAGLTTRDAAMESLVLAASMIAAAGGGEMASQLAPENLEFVRANRATLEQMQKKNEAAARGTQP